MTVRVLDACVTGGEELLPSVSPRCIGNLVRGGVMGIFEGASTCGSCPCSGDHNIRFSFRGLERVTGGY